MTRRLPLLLTSALLAGALGCEPDTGDPAAEVLEVPGDPDTATGTGEGTPIPEDEALPEPAPEPGVVVVGDATEPEGEPETPVWPVFTDVTDEMGLPCLYGPTTSIVDVDEDGWPDLLTGGDQDHKGLTEIFLNEAGLGFVPIGLGARLHPGEELLPDVDSTASADLDGDGDQELVLGGWREGRVQVLWNRGKLTFEAETVYSSDMHPGAKAVGLELADLDRDGWTDLYVSLRIPETAVSSKESLHPNAVLRNLGGGVFLDLTKELWPIYFCGARQTWSAAFVPRGAVDLPDLLYVANDLADDCAWEVDLVDNAFVFTKPEGSGPLVDGAVFSVGLDWEFDDATGDVLLALTQAGHVAFRRLGDAVMADVPDLFPAQDEAFLNTSAVLLDADNDGDRDLVVASGIGTHSGKYVDWLGETYEVGEIPDQNRLFYYERLPDGTFADRSDAGGDPFVPDTGDWFGISRGDLDRDGCVDLVVTPRKKVTKTKSFETDPSTYLPEEDTYDYDGPGIRVLRNGCPLRKNRWLGVRVADVPGTVVTLSLSDGTARHEVVKGSTGVASRSGSGLVHFGLGRSGAAPDVAGVEVRLPTGEVSHAVEAPPLDQVLDLVGE